jgi:hypothetical protein
VPVAPYAAILVTINSGAPARGGIEASFGDTVQLYAESTIGWGIPAAIWEITTYPAGWPPPPGWSIDPVTKAYVLLGNVSLLPPFQLPAASTGLWGKWKFRLRVNGGGGALTDWSTAVEIVSPRGVHDLAASEGSEFGAERGWPGGQQGNLRLLDQALAGAGSTLASIGVTPPLEATGPSNQPVLGIALATDTADGAMSHEDKATLDAATSNPTPGTLAARDGVGSASFHVLGLEAGLTFTPSGAFNVTQGQAASGSGGQATIRGQQGAAGQNGGPLLLGGGDAGLPGEAHAWAGNTLIQLGQPDAATQSTAALELIAGTGAFLGVVCQGGSAAITVPKGLTLAMGNAVVALLPTALVLDVPIVELANTAAPPTTNPVGAVSLYVAANAFQARGTAGVVTTIAPAGAQGAPTATLLLLDAIAANLDTTSNASTPLLTYVLPENAAVEIDASIQARNPANGNSSWFRRIVRAQRATAAPTIKTTSTPIPDEDETGGLTVTAEILGTTAVSIAVKGLAGTTLAWFGSARVQVFAP